MTLFWVATLIIIFAWGIFICVSVDRLRAENAQLKIKIAKDELNKRYKEDPK